MMEQIIYAKLFHYVKISPTEYKLLYIIDSSQSDQWNKFHQQTSHIYKEANPSANEQPPTPSPALPYTSYEPMPLVS